MKLIAKHRDFYDQTIYQFGVDPLLIWKRNPEYRSMDEIGKIICPDHPWRYRTHKEFTDSIHAAYVIVNNRVFIYAYSINKDVMGIPMEPPHRYKFYNPREVFYKTRSRYDTCRKWEEFVDVVQERYGDLTDKLGVPIVGYLPQPGHLCRAQKCVAGEDYSNWWTNPLLSGLPITKDLTAQEVYEEILKFFCRTAQPKDPSPQPESSRIEAHGFDLKTSFRHRK